MIKKILFLILFISYSTPIIATNYYVKSDGDDGKDGLSDATAWKTIGKVNAFIFESGDDLYLKCGSVWKLKALSINWSGTEDNYANVGAYYGDGIIGVSGEKPTIDGEYLDLDNSYAGLIAVFGNYITISNLRILGSVTRGISVEGRNHINVYNCNINKTFTQGVIFSTVENGNIEDNEFMDCARQEEESTVLRFATSLAVMHKCKNINVRRNNVHDTHGEAINSFDRNDGILIEHNICYNFRSVGIYMDNSRNTIVRYNLVYNTDDRTYWRTSTGPGMGIWNTVEPFGAESYNNNLEIYGNLVAWCKIGLCINGDGLSDVPAKNVKYYNNTIIDCEVNLQGWVLDFENCEIKNNIFYKLSSNCEQVGWSSKPAGLIISNNLWSTSVPASILGTGSIVADPKLFKNSNWRDLPAGNVQANLFALLPESPVIDAGTILDSTYAEILDQATVFTQFVRTKDQRNYGSGWEMGGIVYTGINEQATLPSPANHATDIDIESDTTLSWVSGDNAISHNIYFGKADSLQFIVNQTDTSYSLTNLDYFKVYQWRIDEVTATDTVRGILWSFKTAYEKLPPESAFNLLPNNEQIEVQLNAQLLWEAGYRTENHDVYFGTTNPPPFKTNQESTSYTPDNLELNTTYYWRIDEKNDHGITEGTILSFKTIENPILPDGWFSADIGDVGLSGKGKESGGVFTISGSGDELTGSEDALYFTYTDFSGDGEIIAKIVSQGNTDGWAQAGLMIREDMSTGSKYTSLAITPENGIVSQTRKKSSTNSEQNLKDAVAAPYWIKLMRASSKYFFGQISVDGKNWKGVKQEELSFNSSTKIGFFVVAANNDSLSTAIFDSVSINGEPVSIEENLQSDLVPKEFSIGNYPNPFNPSTKIKFSLPENGKVSIVIYDMLGREVKKLLNEDKKAGIHLMEWNTTNSLNRKVSSGIYFYKVIFNSSVKTKKMILIR